MTWEELTEEAKKMGYSLNTEHVWHFLCKEQSEDATILFYKSGIIEYQLDGEKSYTKIEISSDRTPEEMLAVMKALQ